MQSTEDIYFNDEPLKQKLVRKGFWLYFLTFLSAPTGYLIKIMVSQSLPIADFGLVYGILSLMTILTTYNDLGLTEALQYYLPKFLLWKKYKEAKSLLVTTRIVQFISGVVVGVLLIVFIPFLTTHYFHHPATGDMLKIFALYFLIINFYQVLQSLFIAVQDVKRTYWVEVIRLWSIVAMLVVSWYMNTVTLHKFALFWLFGMMIATIVCFIWAMQKFWWIFKQYPFVLDRRMIWEQRKYAFWILISINLMNVLTNIDQQLIIVKLGTTQAAYRTNYMSLMNIVNFLVTPIIWYIFPLINELVTKKQPEKIILLYKYLYMWFGALSIVVAIVGRFWGPAISSLLFGPQYLISWLLFKYAAPFARIFIFTNLQLQYLAWSGDVRRRVAFLWVALVFNVILTYILLHMVWLFGSLIASVATRLILWIFTSRMLYMHYKNHILHTK